MRNTHYTALLMAVVALNGLDKHKMIIPDAPAVGEMAESSPVVAEATYSLRCHKAEYVATPKTANAKGPYIKTQFIITGPGDGAHIGRYVFMNYSLTGDGSFRLRELLAQTGHPDDFKLTDSDQLVGLELRAAVGIEKGTGGYSDKNVIKKHMPLVEVQQTVNA